MNVSSVYSASQVKIWQNIFLPNFYYYLTNDWGIAIFREKIAWILAITIYLDTIDKDLPLPYENSYIYFNP